MTISHIELNFFFFAIHTHAYFMKKKKLKIENNNNIIIIIYFLFFFNWPMRILLGKTFTPPRARGSHGKKKMKKNFQKILFTNNFHQQISHLYLITQSRGTWGSRPPFSCLDRLSWGGRTKSDMVLKRLEIAKASQKSEKK